MKVRCPKCHKTFELKEAEKLEMHMWGSTYTIYKCPHCCVHIEKKFLEEV